MKTKISHLGRSTVSVILAVMMLLSTMLIGTVSTVNAVDIQYYYRGSENNWNTTEMTPISGTSLYYYKSNNFSKTNNFKISDGTVWENSSNYGANNVKENSEIEISKLSGDDNNNASISAQSSEYYIIFDSKDKKMYATFSLPIEPTEPTTATDSSAETTQPVTGDYYFWYSTNDNIQQYSGNWKAVRMTQNGSSYYVSNLPVNVGSNFYFLVNKNAEIPYRNTVWKAKNEVTVDCSTCASNFSSSAPQERYVPKESDPNQTEPVFYYYISVKTNGSYSFTFDGGKSVTVTEGSPEPSETVKIKVPTVDNATVTAVANSKTYNEGDSFDIEVGSSFTVNVTGENGYTLNKITYGTKSETETGAKFTAVSGVETFSVDMVQTVSNPVKVTFSSNNSDYGTVSAKHNGADFTSGGTVKVGDEVTFTATPSKGYTFTGWTVNDASVSPTTNPYTITVNNNTTVTANFKVEDSGTPSGYYILWGKNASFSKYEAKELYLKDDGKYYANFDVATDKIGTKENCYFVFSTSNTTNGVTREETNVTINEVAQNKFYFESNNSDISGIGNTRVPKIWNENADLLGFKIIVSGIDLPNRKVTYSCEPTFDVAPADTVEITAKDGTIRAGYTDTVDKKTTAVLGDTELSITTPDNEIINASPSYLIDGENRAVTAKRVPYGSTVTVKTTINPDATFAGHSGSDYYVKGFSINGFTGGVLTQQAGNSHTSDVYEYTFTVKEDVYADVSTIEITPIYFLKNDSDCVTFYVENFMDAKAKWGDTIACYAYYSSDHALGDYPGQPMVNAEGSIYMQIPKHIGTDASNVVKGITLNNYVWDFVHVSGDDKARESKNCQTYDYDDFKYLANMSKVNSSDSADDIKNIVYRFKYHTYNNTSAEAGNVPNDTLTGTKVDDTKYEVFVDYYDKPTDIFGTIIKGNDAITVDTVKAQPEYLTIVSDGYVNYYKDTANYLGQYATKWYIYNEADQKVAALPPSALLYGLTKSSAQLENLVTQDTAPADFMSDSGASADLISGYWASFKSLYTKYAGKYAIINYESSIHSSGRDGAIKQPGERCDGRWYYSVDKAKITGDIKIEYADTLDSFTTMTGVKTDTFIEGTATGKNTAAEAYFTSPADQSTAVKPTHVETTSDNSENFKFTVGATSSTTSGYTFVGWYRLIDDTYKAVNDPSELNKTTGQVARNANVVLVARYIKTPGGSMTFQHSLYNGTNAGGGKATTEIQVVVKNSKGELLYNSEKIAGTASIDKTKIAELARQADLTVTVTLYTTTKNLYNFNGYYSAENTTDITAFNPTTGFTTNVSGDRTKGLVTKSEYKFSFNDYYTKHYDILTAADAGTVYYNFYSDITSIKVPYKVQFSYTDRMGDQKYYNKAGYVDPENTSSYTFVENATNVEGVESHSVKVTLTNSFILTLAPYESNFTKNLTWNETPDSNTAFDSSVNSSIASAVVKSTQSDRTIHLNVFRDKNTNEPTSYNNENGNFVLFTKKGSSELPYGSVFYTSNGDGTYTYDITAPKTYKDNQFMYWAIYSDPECKNLVINAYNSEGHFSYVAYDNCWIVPVYGKSSTPVASVKEVSTSTQFMEVTRNQWTAENTDSFTGLDADSMTTLDKTDDFIKGDGEDKLYADFVLNFFYNGKQLSVFDPDSKKVQTGIVMQKLELEKDSIGVGYNTDMKYYANKYIDNLPTAAEDAKSKILTGNSSIESLTKQIDNKRLDNKNRLQYYARFNNTETNANCVYRVYTYIKYLDESNKPVVKLGDPIYFTLYDIANATV